MPASKRNGMFDANADLSADPAENIAAASWWPSLEGGQEATGHRTGGTAGGLSRRRLNGEIQLSTTLKPSSRIAHFAVEVSRRSRSTLHVLTESYQVRRRGAAVQSHRIYVGGCQTAAKAERRDCHDVREQLPAAPRICPAAIQRRRRRDAGQLLQRGWAGTCMADVIRAGHLRSFAIAISGYTRTPAAWSDFELFHVLHARRSSRASSAEGGLDSMI